MLHRIQFLSCLLASAAGRCKQSLAARTLLRRKWGWSMLVRQVSYAWRPVQCQSAVRSWVFWLNNNQERSFLLQLPGLFADGRK
ncbi:hypothetical protein BJY52DRAFT_1282218 [Lactarius psammicola]|nr:hypothetical protein BJY52DRAFT_1282218 [Lactarius psammicola]